MENKIDNQPTSRAPSFAKPLKVVLEFFDRLFDWVYGSKFNPLYRSGTLATGLLFVVIGTGFYLLFFYRLGSPFESVQAIQDMPFAARWVRSLHRYASDAVVVALAFHVLRMLVEGKTWGPRVLAWVSGVLMMIVLFASGWTGYVMVWDRHGQTLAIAGAHILDLLPIFSEPISRAFSGVSPILGSFFFMNLFLHVALPLGMIVALWIHTLKLARSAWLPFPRILWISVGSLIALSVILPAPLAGAPDLLAIQGVIPVDWFYSSLLWLDWNTTPVINAGVWVSISAVLLSMPLWWKPRKGRQPLLSAHDQARCEGCEQCMLDCPFEAIDMVPRTVGAGSEKVANVHLDKCVGCGLCSGSCSQLAIGPSDRDAKVQIQRVRKLRAAHARGGIALVYCNQQPGLERLVARAEKRGIVLAPMSFDCLGSIHPATMVLLLGFFDGAFIWGCPARVCINREGLQLFTDRMIGERNPAMPGRIDANKLHIFSGTQAEFDVLESELAQFAAKIKGETVAKRPSGLLAKRVAKIAALNILIMGFIWYFSRLEAGVVPETSYLRISWKVPRQIVQTCRDFTEAEIAAMPRHMRRTKECTNAPIPYMLEVEVDGEKLVEEVITSKGARQDRPMNVDVVREIKPGTHTVKVEFVPQQGANLDDSHPLEYKHEFSAEFGKGRAVAVGYDSSARALIHVK